MKQETKPAIDRLLRGISTDHVETVRGAWREILGAGTKSVPLIQDKLRSSPWDENPSILKSKYFSVLLSLLDELDASAFEKEVTRLRNCSLHPLHSKTLDFLSRRVLEDPLALIASGIPVYISSDIVESPVVIKDIQGWSKTKGLSLDAVTRIDVIARHAELDYLGKYNLFFSGITLTWPTDRAKGVKRWWRRLGAEYTFYHEVGHHVSGHIEGGQVAEQEQKADEYARSMMRNSRPVLTFFGRMLLRPLVWLFKRLIASTRSREG